MAVPSAQALSTALRKSRLARALAGFQRNNQAITAGHLAFLALVSLFPFLIVLVTVAGVIGSTASAQLALARGLDALPPDVAGVLGPVADQITAEPRGGVLTLGLASALWAASSGLEALRFAFNRAYRVRQQRQLWWRRLQSLMLTLLFASVVAAATLLNVVVPLLVDAAATLLDRPEWRTTGGPVVSGAMGGIVLVLATAALYRTLPRPDVGWLEALPGALVAVVGWMALANLFGLYLAEVAHLSPTYGSLGGVVATLLFFYLTACVVLFGCELNAAARHPPNDARP